MAAEGTTNIATLHSDVLSQTVQPVKTIGELEAALLSLFPAADAEDWDHTGLLVGDRASKVKAVALALDATVDTIRIAAQQGANVLITHHPAFLEGPQSFGPLESGVFGPGSVVWEAVSQGVALMNFHTTLDRSAAASFVLPSMLSLEYIGIVQPLVSDSSKGYGQICRFPAGQEALNLEQLAARCVSVFGRTPRVYGSPSQKIERIVTCTGSASSLVELCLEQQCDVLICGEVRYHSALDAESAGLSIIELGHDVSELPLCAVLAQALGSIGIPEGSIQVIDQGFNWWTPEATRR